MKSTDIEGRLKKNKDLEKKILSFLSKEGFEMINLNSWLEPIDKAKDLRIEEISEYKNGFSIKIGPEWFATEYHFYPKRNTRLGVHIHDYSLTILREDEKPLIKDEKIYEISLEMYSKKSNKR